MLTAIKSAAAAAAKAAEKPKASNAATARTEAPKTGPLTIAKIRSKIDTESGDRNHHDVQELVRRNGGV